MATNRGDWVFRLFKEQGGALRRFIRARYRRDTDVEDLTQDVFLRMLRIANPDEIRDPVGYLLTVAANVVRERQQRDWAASRADPWDDRIGEQIASEGPSMEEVLDAFCRSERLQVVLDELPLKCQATVMLKYVRGLSYEEIGEQLLISPSMVKKYLRRAIEHARRRMGSLE